MTSTNAMDSLRNPIHPGLLPRPLAWERSSDALSDRLAVLRSGKRLEQPLGSSPSNPVHLRLVEPSTGKAIRFVRMVNRQARAEADFSAAVTASLVSAGVQTPRIISVEEIDETELAIVYEWLDGTYPLARDLDFRALGQAVAAFQAAIGPLDSSHALTEATQSRLSRIVAVSSEAMLLRDWPDWTGCPEAAANISRFPDLCAQILEDAVPSHGDLNPANLLQTESGFAFLDFEDVRHMRVWWGFDIAKLAERLVLSREEAFGRDWARSALSDLVEGYFKGSSRRPQPGFGEALLRAARWHVALSMLVVRNSSRRDTPALAAELEKLSGLARLIEAKSALFVDLDPIRLNL